MPKSNYEPNNLKKRSYRKYFILWGALAVLVFVVGLLVGYLKTAEAPQPPPSDVYQGERTLTKVLLYISMTHLPSFMHIYDMGRQVTYFSDTSSC